MSSGKSKKTTIPTSALGGTAVGEQGSLISSGSLNISVANFLDDVKDIPLINEVFSKNVADKLGVNRTIGTLTPDIRYSLDISSEETFPNGTRVKANDRGNVGVIVGYDNTTKAYSVKFISKEGLTSTLQMYEDQFVPI